MANLEKDYNIYTDLSQGAYTGRENNFPYNELKPSQQNKLNDWVDNNLVFAENKFIPQAKLATEAMYQKIEEMRTKAPSATMSMTGHSLGTMVTIQV